MTKGLAIWLVLLGAAYTAGVLVTRDTVRQNRLTAAYLDDLLHHHRVVWISPDTEGRCPL